MLIADYFLPMESWGDGEMERSGHSMT